MKFGLALFHLLMRLMPRWYSVEQRADATALTATLARDARQRRGAFAALGVTLAALADLIVRIGIEWARPLGPLLSLRGITGDLHHGFRAMVARPGHSAAVIVTLALGIGLNAAVFSVVDWVLLRPLPYPASASLVRVSAGDQRSSAGDLSYSEVEAFSKATSFRHGAAFAMVTRVASAPAVDPVHVTIARVTGDLFSVLGTYPAIGRAFDAQELDSGRRVVVLSHAIWRDRFASRPAIAGSVVTLDNEPHTIVGVMPAGRGYPHEADIWRPSTAEEREDDDRENVMIARLAAAADESAATAELTTLQPAANGSRRQVWVESLQSAEVRDVRAVLLWALIGAGLVLAVACANVAGLIGTSAMDRAGELAVRGALGASRAELGRQLLIENMVLAIAGGALGIIAGAGALDVLVALAPQGLPRLDDITLDARVMGASALVMLLVGVAVSVAPAWHAARTDLTTTLQRSASARTVTGAGARRVLATAQVAGAVVLTTGAALLGRSLQHLVAIDHGFEPDGVIAVSLNVRGIAPAEARTLFGTLADQAATIPGVRSAAVAFRLPTDVVGLRAPMRVEGAVMDPVSVAVRIVTPRYFDTVGLPIVSGRAFGASDTRDGRRVGVVNRAFVREVAGGANAIDARLTGELIAGGVTIVGIAGDVTPGGQPDRPALYMSYEQLSINAGSLVVKSAGDPAALIAPLRSRIRAIAPALPLDRVETLNDVLATGRAVVRFNSLVASSFGLLALTLAIIGVYGVTSREVALRRRESGLRAALGASRGALMAQLLRPVGTVVLVGLAGGLVAAGAMGHSIAALLHGVSPADPVTLLLVPAAIALVATAAAVSAAWPVVRSDPASVLR